MIRQKGFTLLELLLAMALTAMLLTLVSIGMGTVIDDWQDDSSVLDRALDQSLALLQIERALVAAFPHSYIDRDELERFIYFDGTPDRLSWVSTVSPQRRSGHTAWHLETDEYEGGVLLTLTPAYSDNPDARLFNATPVLLLPNYRAEFSYLMQENDEEKVWLGEWHGYEYQSLPIAVHIRFIPLEPGRDQPLELLAPIRNHEHEDIDATLPIQ